MQSAGSRNCLCTLMEDHNGETDAVGESIPTPRQVAKFWASIETLGTAKVMAFDQQYPTATMRLITPWTRSWVPTPAMWVAFRGRRLEIVGAENFNELNQEWHIHCVEGVAVREGATP